MQRKRGELVPIGEALAAERFLSARPHGPNAPVWGVMLSNAIK